jgi:enoyl-CoA hydratase
MTIGHRAHLVPPADDLADRHRDDVGVAVLVHPAVRVRHERFCNGIGNGSGAPSSVHLLLALTMNRPEARNALSGEMLAIMEQAWVRANEDPEVRVVILTGAGGYSCAGTDLKAMSSDSPSDRFESGEFDTSVIPSLLKGYRLTKPLISAVEGPAIAGGTEILQATDIRVAGVGPVRRVRTEVGALPAGRLRRTARAPAALHRGGRPAAYRQAHQGSRHEGDRPDRPRRTRRGGAGQGPRDRRADRGQRSARRQAVLKTIRDSEDKHENECWQDDAEVGAAVFASNDAKEGPRALAEKRPRTSPGPELGEHHPHDGCSASALVTPARGPALGGIGWPSGA